MSYTPLSVGACDSVGGAETVGLAVVGMAVGPGVGGMVVGREDIVGDADGEVASGEQNPQDASHRPAPLHVEQRKASQ